MTAETVIISMHRVTNTRILPNWKLILPVLPMTLFSNVTNHVLTFGLQIYKFLSFLSFFVFMLEGLSSQRGSGSINRDVYMFVI